MTSQTYPSGRVVSYSYDSASRLSAVSSGATVYAGGLTYKPFGGLESATLGNGALYSMGYDEARLQLSSVSLTQGATTVQRYEYRYGRVNTATGEVDATKNNGQVGRIEGFVGTQKQWQQRFSYDSLGRLSSAGEVRGDNGGQSYLLNYDYDVYGNRLQQDSRNDNLDSNGQPVITQHFVEAGDYSPATNRFTSGVTYDAAGNVTTDSRFRLRQFLYDANNRQKQSSNLDGSNPVTSVYDGAGQRVATKAGGVLTNVMVYDAGGKLVAEYAQSVSAAGTQYVMGDHQGSTRVVMNATGANSGIVSRHDYLPFGEDVPGSVGLRASTTGYGQADGVRHRYAGMEQDEVTEMSHTLWREFDNRSARWTSPDPYGGSMAIADPQSFNRYTYVNNDPVNLKDSLGLMKEVPHDDLEEKQKWFDDAVQAAKAERSFGDVITILHPKPLPQAQSLDASSTDTRDDLKGAVSNSPGVAPRFHEGHYGPHVLSPPGGGVAKTLPSLAGVVIYWGMQEGGKNPLYKVYVKPDAGNFIVVYEDLSSVSRSITSKVPKGKITLNSGVRLNAQDTIGRVRSPYPNDPENRSQIGLHVQFVRREFFNAWHTNVRADAGKQAAGKSLGAKSPLSYFINPCGAGSPVRCN